jgi:hypothetical protein
LMPTLSIALCLGSSSQQPMLATGSARKFRGFHVIR